jgi:hypothetical protein
MPTGYLSIAFEHRVISSAVQRSSAAAADAAAAAAAEAAAAAAAFSFMAATPLICSTARLQSPCKHKLLYSCGKG